MTNCFLFIGFLWLAVCALTCNARTFTQEELEELYQNATELYWESKYHWTMSDGYEDMLGEAGMKVCFVDGPEREALVLGGEFSNLSSNATLELQNDQESVSITDYTAFTLSLWYSFRPVDFFAEFNNSMTCNLVQLESSDKKVEISYNGGKEYNLKYSYQAGTSKRAIDDNAVRQNWEFEVNDTFKGAVISRGWQWNHIAMGFDGDSLKAYFNGFTINMTAATEDQGEESSLSRLLLNAPVGDKTQACGPVGLDEVAIWSRALGDEEHLALRVHVGRNRSLDEPKPTTDVPETTALPETTPSATTPKATTEEATTAGYSTEAETTEQASTPGDTTLQETSSALDGTSTMPHTTASETTPKQSTDTTMGDQTTTGATTTLGTGAGHSTETPAGYTTTSAPMATKLSAVAMEVDKLTEEIENITHIPAQEVTEILHKTEEIIENATTMAAYRSSTTLIKLLKITSQVPPAKVNSSSADIAVVTDYRKAFVSLFSKVLVVWDDTEQPDINAGEVVEVMDIFLGNYVEDPTVTENASIFTNGIDVQLAPAEGSNVQMDDQTNISIPTGAFDFATRGVKVVICLLKRGLQNVLEPKGNEQPNDLEQEYSKKPTWNISGPIVVMKVAGHTSSVLLQKPISFEMQVDPSLGEDPVCVYQEGMAWSGRGVKLGKYDQEGASVTCKTTHMTNFAVLMAVDGVKLEGPHAVLLSIISYIGCSLSLLCLVIAIILFIILRELSSTRMGIVKNLCVALFLAQLLFVAGIETASVNEIACKAVAALLHYFFLCVMAWMLCNGIYLYQKVNRATRPGSVVDLIYFCILGWGAPAIVVAITAGINHNVYGTPGLCWLSVEGNGIWAFVIPAMLIIVFNAFVTFLTMKAFVSVKVFKDKSDKDKFKSGLRAVVVMLPILGLSWIFGLLAFGDSGIFFQYLFAIFNSLQGVFLFIFHILLNDEVKGAMRRRFGKVGASGDENMLFNKIWAFSTTEKTEMSSVSQTEKKMTKPVYKN